jgi:hypothetical protein
MSQQHGNTQHGNQQHGNTQHGNNGQKRHDKRRRSNNKPQAIDVWRNPGEMPEVRPIADPTDVGALLRSLGDPPVGNGTAAAHYFNAVVERAAAVALALAVSADLLDSDA